MLKTWNFLLNIINYQVNVIYKYNLKKIILSKMYFTETAKNLEKSLKEDIQQLNRCIVDKNAKISTLELFSKTNNDELKKKNNELEHFYKRARDEVTAIKLYHINNYNIN